MQEVSPESLVAIGTAVGAGAATLVRLVIRFYQAKQQAGAANRSQSHSEVVALRNQESEDFKLITQELRNFNTLLIEQHKEELGEVMKLRSELAATREELAEVHRQHDQCKRDVAELRQRLEALENRV